jgi:predicted dehydrogenase
MNRRGFLKGASGIAAGAIGFPYLIPSSALGKSGTVAPSNRLVMGAIGVGDMGTADLSGFLDKNEVQVVAVCDVDMNHAANAKKLVNEKYNNKSCESYKDYRDLIARGAHFHRAAELVRNGRIGEVKYVEVGLPDGKGSGTFPTTPVPAGMDYDMWLGPAPWREHTGFGRRSVHWDWRWVMDYSGGQLTDWAGHHIDIAHWGLGFDKTGPVKVCDAKGTYPTSGTYDVPTAYKFKCKYANGVEMVVANESQLPHGMGACWYGTDGRWIHVSRGGLTASSDAILKEVIGPEETKLYKSLNHLQNFIDCVKSRKETITPVETAHRSISVGLLGEIAMLRGKDLDWDPAKEVFTNDETANRYLSRPMRSPWHL